MSEYPATSLALNKGKYYVLLTIPLELRQHFNGRKQLKKSTGTSDLGDAKRRQHNLSAELYAQLDACKPDLRDVNSDHLGWIGDAEEIQRLEFNGDLEGTIMAHKYAEDTHDPELDPDDSCIDLVHEGGARALEVYREWKAQQSLGTVASGSPTLSTASEDYFETDPYGPIKTTNAAKLAVKQFQEFTGDVPLADVTSVMIHDYAEHLGKTKGQRTIVTKISFVKRMFDHAVRKGWIPYNVFTGLVLNKKVGRAKISYGVFTTDELVKLFSLDMPVNRAGFAGG